MPTLIWHPDALDDVARLYDFLAPASPSAAQRAASAIKDAADRIADNPGLGTPRAEFREWPAKFGRSAYILRYFVLSSGDVLITRVWHSREQRQG
ncbi:MAG: type II toxin-antitoxin system RelE/ParE family toxin [Thiobacillaceae bacterium]